MNATRTMLCCAGLLATLAARGQTAGLDSIKPGNYVPQGQQPVAEGIPAADGAPRAVAEPEVIPGLEAVKPGQYGEEQQAAPPVAIVKARRDQLSLELQEKEAEHAKAVAEAEAAAARAAALGEEVGRLKEQIAELGAVVRGGDRLEEYQALAARFDAKLKELEAWIATNPEKNEANQQKFLKLRGELAELSRRLDAF